MNIILITIGIGYILLGYFTGSTFAEYNFWLATLSNFALSFAGGAIIAAGVLGILYK